MIRTITTITEDVVSDWTELFRRSPEFRVDLAGRVPTAVPVAVAPPPGAPVTYALPDYNVLHTPDYPTIVASDGTPVRSYIPVEGDKLVSKVQMARALSAGATLAYTTTRVTFRSNLSPRQQLTTPLVSPRMLIVYGKTIDYRVTKQQNDDGDDVQGKVMLLTINLDTDDNTGGPKACQYLLNLAEAVIRRNSNWLFEQGYEQVKVTPNFAELPNKEGAIALYRGSITVSAVIYPRIYED